MTCFWNFLIGPSPISENKSFYSRSSTVAEPAHLEIVNGWFPVGCEPTYTIKATLLRRKTTVVMKMILSKSGVSPFWEQSRRQYSFVAAALAQPLGKLWRTRKTSKDGTTVGTTKHCMVRYHLGLFALQDSMAFCGTSLTLWICKIYYSLSRHYCMVGYHLGLFACFWDSMAFCRTSLTLLI